MADKRKYRTRGNQPKLDQPKLQNESLVLKNRHSNYTITINYLQEVNSRLQADKSRLQADNSRLQDDNSTLQAEKKELIKQNTNLRKKVDKLNSSLWQQENKKTENTIKENKTVRIREYEDEIKKLKEQLEQEKESHALQAKLEKQKLADLMKQFKVTLQDNVFSSITSLLEEMNEKMCNIIYQHCKRIEGLNGQTEELTKQLKERDYNVSKMKAEMLARNDHLNKQLEELKSHNDKLVSQIDKEKHHKVQHAKRLDELRKEFVSKIEEFLAKFEKDITVWMQGRSTIIQSTNSKLVYAISILKKINARKLEDEEESYKFTNAFTSAGEGSVLDISKRYRHLQHNMRASAVRASKQVYKVPAKTFFCKQTMNAYETAKTMLLEESGKCINMHLIKLQASDKTLTEKMLNACMRIVDCVANNEVTSNAIKRITEELKLRDAKERTDAAKDDSLAPDVAKYYNTLAELTWQAISRPIPMVYGMEEQTYKKDLHDVKDGDSNDEGKPVVYVYPVLYSSNQWPRQIAQIGRVELDE